MSAPTAYLTIAEATAIIEAVSHSTLDLRRAWASATDADRGAALLAASDDIDACQWAGFPLYNGVLAGGRGQIIGGDYGSAPQTRQWPRKLFVAGGAAWEPYTPPSGWPAGQPSVAGLPWAVRKACAVQACWRLLRGQGVDPTQHVLDAAARGVTSQSGGGHTEAIDLAHATSPFASLHQAAQQMLARYTRTGGHFL